MAIKSITDLVDGGVATADEFYENLHRASEELQKKLTEIMLALHDRPLSHWAAGHRHASSPPPPSQAQGEAAAGVVESASAASGAGGGSGGAGGLGGRAAAAAEAGAGPRWKSMLGGVVLGAAATAVAAVVIGQSRRR